MKISSQHIKKLIEPHFHESIVLESYKVSCIKATKLLTNNRLDIAFKLLYLEMMDKDVEFAKEIYIDHIRAFSLGKFIEPGYEKEKKNSIDKFIREFHKTYENIKQNGFDKGKTLIPLSKNGSVANGVHRVASAIYLKKDVACVEIDTADHVYDYKFFYARNIPNEILDIVATKFLEYAENVYIAFIWPIAETRDEEIENEEKTKSAKQSAIIENDVCIDKQSSVPRSDIVTDVIL